MPGFGLPKCWLATSIYDLHLFTKYDSMVNPFITFINSNLKNPSKNILKARYLELLEPTKTFFQSAYSTLLLTSLVHLCIPQ